MTVSYRNTRPNFYSDKYADTTEIGTITTTFKATTAVYDNSLVPLTPYKTTSGNAQTGTNPEFQYPGYLYCDGTEYNISDFPALFKIIGTDYGGSARRGFSITNEGSGYASSTTITFDAAPTGGETIEATLIIDSGKITGVAATKLGAGYTTEPSFTLANTGGGTGFAMQINLSDDGVVTDINTSNVFSHLGESRPLGTFKVPDLKTRKIVGYGNVYGPGSPTIANITLGAGADSTGGSWYLDKQSQKGYFSLGTITTTNYTAVTDSVNTSIIGSQVVKVTMRNRRLQGVPQHTHFVYHTSTNSGLTVPSGYSGDRYMADYTNYNSRLYGWYPVGGIQFEHKHALLKQPLTDATVATYDIYDWKMGAQGTGDIKVTEPDGTESEYYYASGSTSSGSYETVTYIPPTVFKVFGSQSVIGGREVRTGGSPIIDYSNQYTYTSPQTNTSLAFPSGWEVLSVYVGGAGGSGSPGNQDGNDGSKSEVSIGGALTITANGGEGGGKPNTNHSYLGGSGGSGSVTGSVASTVSVISNTASSGTNGGVGPYPGGTYPSNPGFVGEGGEVDFAGNGSDGNHTYTGSLGQVQETLVNYGQTQTVTLASQYDWHKIEIEVVGGKGSNAQIWPGTGSIQSGNGRAGTYMKLEVPNPAGTYQFYAHPGATGGVRQGGSGYSNGSGGWGGDGYTDDGGGGGGLSVIKVGSDIWAGAAGGGGGGGLQAGSSPYNGRDGRSRTSAGGGWASDDPHAGSSPLFTGGGNTGGNYGCVGGGGGGGGGGCGPSNYNPGGASGGGGGPAGHGGGEGGISGMSAYRNDKLNLVNSYVGNLGNGYIKFIYQEDSSAWSDGGGGGGSGRYLRVLTEKTILGSQTSMSITVGSGGAGVGGTTSGENGKVEVGFGVITGWQGGETSTTVGDIILKASDGIDIYDSGTGAGDTGGFRLPTHQIPEVEFVNAGTGGSGASATVTVGNSLVSGISLDTPNNSAGYSKNPNVRIKHGAGTGAYATATVDTTTQTVDAIALSSLVTPAAYTRYVKFGGDDLERWIIIKEHDCTNVSKFTVKAARGNGNNGGNLPENGGDELKVYYNTDMSENFGNFLGVLVPIPTATEISSNYDGTGSGNEATKWYWYTVDLPTDAQKPSTRFKIVQDRNAAGAGNDNAADSDHYGICDFIYEYKEITELQFVSSAGRIPRTADELTYEVEGPAGSFYPSGAIGNDATFTLTAQTPLVPTAAIDPDIHVPLVEPYHLCKYLIKAF